MTSIWVVRTDDTNGRREMLSFILTVVVVVGVYETVKNAAWIIRDMRKG
jgi:hypothetical protein